MSVSSRADAGAERRRPGTLVVHGAVAFGRFWWEFLVGDTPELLVGAIIAIALVALLVHSGVSRAVTVVCLPVLVVAVLATSVRRARRSGRPSERNGS